MNARILVADDQIANRELLAEILTAEGFDVINAGDGADALDQFAEGHPDLVLLDPLTARILQIVDVYDALTTRRPYKRALTLAEALETMEQEVQKGWWDQDIFSVFQQVLSDGEEALRRRAQTLVGDLESAGDATTTYTHGGHGGGHRA